MMTESGFQIVSQCLQKHFNFCSLVRVSMRNIVRNYIIQHVPILRFETLSLCISQHVHHVPARIPCMLSFLRISDIGPVIAYSREGVEKMTPFCSRNGSVIQNLERVILPKLCNFRIHSLHLHQNLI